MKHCVASVLSALMLVTAPAVSAEGGIREQQVQFKKGESGATIKGSIKGDQTVDYKLRANAGQTMVVKFKPSNASAYFNVLPPGSDEAIFIGSTSGNDFSGNLAASGEYTIRGQFVQRRSGDRATESARCPETDVVHQDKHDVRGTLRGGDLLRERRLGFLRSEPHRACERRGGDRQYRPIDGLGWCGWFLRCGLDHGACQERNQTEHRVQTHDGILLSRGINGRASGWPLW